MKQDINFKKYKYISAYGKMRGFSGTYIEYDQRKALASDAPLDIIRFNDGIAVLFSDLNNDMKTGLSLFL